MNQLKTVLLLGTLSALLIALGGAISPDALWLFAGLAALMNLGAYFFSDRLVLAMHRAQPIERARAPELHDTVADLARRAGIPMPRVYLIDDPSPNAFATGRNPKHGVVAVTTGILGLLSPRELRGVLAHELAHIQNRDILIGSIAAVIASAIAMIASALRWGAIFGFGGQHSDEREEGGGGVIAALVLAVVAPIAATIIQLAISRSREYGADERGAAISGDPLALASALSRLERGALPHDASAGQLATASLFIVNPFAAGGALAGVARWFSTHPPTAERIRRLQLMAASPARVSADRRKLRAGCLAS